MTTLQLSDLFTARGHSFDWTIRIDDQNRLIERLQALREEADYGAVFQLYLDEFKNFCEEGIASYNFIDDFLTRLTRMCSHQRIDVV